MAYTDEISRLTTARNEGIQIGIQNLVDSLYELNVPTDCIVSKLMDKYGLTKEEAELKVRL